MKNKLKTITILFLIFVLLFVSGCQKKEETRNTNGNTTNDTGNTTNSMGRYVEETLDYPEEIARSNGITLQEDGRYLSFDKGTGMLYESADKGGTWNPGEAAWMKNLEPSTYISDVTISSRGEFAVIYSLPSEDDSYEPMFMYVSADGNVRDVEGPLEDGGYLTDFLFLAEGGLLAADSLGNIYDVDKDNGTISKLFQAEGYVHYMADIGNYIVAVRNQQSYIYNKETKELVDTDTVLDTFLQDTTKVEDGVYSDSNTLLMAQGPEENSIYLACRGGLYYHVIGGSVMEQMIDGSLSTFGDPTVTFFSMIPEEGGTFLVLFSNRELVRYTYDETIPTVPEIELMVYSLEDNQTLRQTISQFQKDHPEIYVNYEIGMTGEDGITQEDAIKNLNTEIMAGEGPDIVLMDGLPMDTYVDKGMLLDISSVLKELEADDQLLSNIADTYLKDGKTYGIPAKFIVPMIAGESSYVDKISDLAALASTMKEIRSQKAEGSILGIYTESELLNLLSVSCAPAWVSEGGSLNKDALAEFLTLAREIYETEKQGITPEMEQKYQDTKYSFMGQTEELYLRESFSIVDVYTGKLDLACGYVKSIDSDYTFNTSVFENMDTGCSVRGWDLQAKNVFKPQTIAAVSAKTEHADLSQEFIKLLLSENVQNINFGDGFPVNKVSFDTLAAASTKTGEDTDCTGMLGMDSEDGETLTLEINKMPKEQADNLKAIVQNLSTPDRTDSMIIDSVIELGPSAINGEKSIEEVVTEITNKVQIRLDE